MTEKLELPTELDKDIADKIRALVKENEDRKLPNIKIGQLYRGNFSRHRYLVIDIDSLARLATLYCFEDKLITKAGFESFKKNYTLVYDDINNSIRI